jgi:deoxyribodipyrimidine photo-lyase
MTTLVWFRSDLRIADNPALCAAVAAGAPVVPVYLYAPTEEGAWRPGAASNWWLHQSLTRLGQGLAALGAELCVRASDDSLASLEALVRECGASRVVWNRRYEPAIRARDEIIKRTLRAQGVETESYSSALLHEPWSIRTGSGGPYQVFTPFWRHCKSLADPAEPLPAPRALSAPPKRPSSQSIESLALLPELDWPAGLAAAWTPGEPEAQRRLERFTHEALEDYTSRRDEPGSAGTSRLSPHLHFGEIGPRQVWHAVRRAAQAQSGNPSWRDSQFLAEIGWREFAHHLLFHFPHTPDQPLRANFARFPWQPGGAPLHAWQRGATGYPLVDAGMRELWRTGWMHNRVRMITASFLVKDLLIPWISGARWFWDTLVDADLASNTLGWQWVAGCGADAAPFFRVFNPVTQGSRFDGAATYVRRWVPELAALPDDWIHQPWAAPAPVLHAAGVTLGIDYPKPLVDHEAARQRALQAFASIRG